MKRLTFLLSIVLFLIVISGCENAAITKLKKEITEANASCPVNLGIGGDLLSIKYQEKKNRVILYYSINEDLGGVLFLKKNKNKFQQQLRLLFSKSESQQMLKDIINAKASLMLIYKAPSSGKTIKFELSYKELKCVRTNPLSDFEIERLTIENKVEVENSRCPYKTEEGTTATKIALVNDNIVYYYEIDETLFDIKELKRNKNVLKDYVSETLMNTKNDLTMQNELRLLVNQNVGYQFRYYGHKSKEYVDIIFTPEELAKYLKR